MRKHPQWHTSLASSLCHAASWAGFGSILATLAAQLSGRVASGCYVLSALCGVVAVLLKTPSDQGGAS